MKKDIFSISIVILLFWGCTFQEAKDNEGGTITVSYPITNWITPNTCAASYKNTDNSITVKIRFYSYIEKWSVTVSTDAPTQTLASDVTYVNMTLKQGAVIRLIAQGSNMIQVMITGTIIDSGTTYNLSNVELGSWSI